VTPEHFWAVSRFFAFLVETGRLPKDADNPGRGFSFNTKTQARKQRDMWSGEELYRLFASPVWTGCHSHFRSQPGDKIIRDSLFWLPLLGLFHGNRLEEFAQLRRGDLGQSEGIWFLDITDEDGRQLKNRQSRRKVPLHPELIRIGFLDYVAEITASPEDQVFPDLKPGGNDRKRGYYFSKRFSSYRAAIGLRRRGLDYHAFRHSVTTKLYEADVSEGWIDLLTGHESGGESRRRYLKAIPLPQLRSAIERVMWPELDLSHLYVRELGDASWPMVATKTAA
jgi:integrase